MLSKVAMMVLLWCGVVTAFCALFPATLQTAFWLGAITGSAFASTVWMVHSHVRQS